MFHVIYTWSVTTENEAEFLVEWEKATNEIHQNVNGALGSFCVQSIDSPDRILTIAKWESRDKWEAFIGSARSGPMKRMHELAMQLSAEGFEQLGDQTKMVPPG